MVDIFLKNALAADPALPHSRITKTRQGTREGLGTAQEKPTMHNAPQIETMDSDLPTQLHWMEDFDDLTVDDLRELPNHMQLGLDLSVFD